MTNNEMRLYFYIRQLIRGILRRSLPSIHLFTINLASLPENDPSYALKKQIKQG
ncbi:hypothetical protein BSUBE1_2517 [Bacillus subtilis E1]|nr:hypothetical protein BSUBE1_2517 [Bacillus subtilis E1]